MLIEDTLPDIAGDDVLVENPPKSSKKNQCKQRKQLSLRSSNYDEGNKGFLDKTEQIARNYDTNNDGIIDLSELKNIIRDLKDKSDKKNLFKKLSIAALSTLAVVLLCNFGLVWATLMLTRQIESKNGALFESSTGLRISTKAQGNHITANINPEFARRLTAIHARRALSSAIGGNVDQSHEDIRRLQESTPAATLEQTKAQIDQIFNDYVDGVSTGVSTSVEGTTFSGIVASGVTYSNKDDCSVYDNIKDIDSNYAFDLTYKVNCCADTTCDIYTRDIDSQRSQRRLDGCFSPLSTVVEKTKGRMLLKDLKQDDMILAANGTYRHFLFWMHTHISQITDFVQIYTSLLEDEPLELTKNHLVFLHGKSVPIQAGNVKVGDMMVGLKGPKPVSKIATVTRKGFYNPLTSDATLMVNGLLTSSAAVHNDSEAQYLHTISKTVAALMQAGCKINPFFCDTQVDVEGDSKNVILHWIILVRTLPLVLQLPIFLSFFIVAVVWIVCYHLFKFLALSWAIVSMTLIQFHRQKKVKNA